MQTHVAYARIGDAAVAMAHTANAHAAHLHTHAPHLGWPASHLSVCGLLGDAAECCKERLALWDERALALVQPHKLVGVIAQPRVKGGADVVRHQERLQFLHDPDGLGNSCAREQRWREEEQQAQGRRLESKLYTHSNTHAHACTIIHTHTQSYTHTHVTACVSYSAETWTSALW